MTVEGEGYQTNLFKENFISPKRISSNTYQSFESFPDLDYLDVKHHKIVKKQMGITNEMNPLSNVENDDDDKNLKQVQKNSLASINTKEKEYENSEYLEKLATKCALYIKRRKRALGIMSRIFQGLKGINLETYTPSQKKRTKKDVHGGNNKKCECNFEVEVPEVKQDAKAYEGQPCKQFFRFPDKSNNHYFFECEAQPDGCMKIRHKKCKEDETFSMAYSECLRPGFLKAMRKSKREPSASKKKVEVPETPMDDSEPANEWLDASQESQKIPPEFKPRPKLKLKIYHLRCKKKAGEIPRRETAKHTVKLPKSDTVHIRDQAHKPALHRIHKHPRSFLSPTNKKEDHTDGPQDEASSFTEDDLEEEEEDDDYDDDEEIEDSTDDDYESHHKKETAEDKKRRQEKLKELFKTGKGTIRGKAKYNEEPGSMNPNSDNFKSIEKNFKTTDPDGFESRDSPRVLIDANIRVDGEITNALSSILASQSKQKPTNDVKSSMPEYLTDK